MTDFKEGDRVNWLSDWGGTSIVGTVRAIDSKKNGLRVAAVKWDNGDFDVQPFDRLAIIALVPDTVMVELSREDARSLVRLGPYYTWYYRVAAACRKALETDPVVTVVNGCTHAKWADGRELHKYKDGTTYWSLNGVIHRTDGPAIEYPNGVKEYWLNGRPMYEKDHEEATK